MKVLWTIFAESQLDNIYDYIQNINLQATVDIYNDSLDESDMLAHNVPCSQTATFEQSGCSPIQPL